VPSPLALARALARRPAGPGSLVRAIEEGIYHRVEVPGQFAAIVATAFPDDDIRRAILEAGERGELDEAARVDAFLAAVDRRLFPVEDWFEDYAAVIQTIPFRPLGFDDEALDDLHTRPGYQALIALIAPDAPAAVARSHLLHERCSVPLETLALLPRRPLSSGRLRGHFGGGPHAAVADMARWLRAETGTVFLDHTYETADWHRWAWTARQIDALAAQWRVADALLDRVDTLATWLEADLPTRFRELLLIAGRRDAGGRSRRAVRRRRKRGRVQRAP